VAWRVFDVAGRWLPLCRFACCPADETPRRLFCVPGLSAATAPLCLTNSLAEFVGEPVVNIPGDFCIAEYRFRSVRTDRCRNGSSN